MDSIKMKGANVEQAIKSALEVLKAEREQVEVLIINEGKGGVLGVFGGEEAEVEVTVKAGEDDQARHYLQQIIDKMGLNAMAGEAKTEDGNIKIEIKGEDLAIIIGKDGSVLDALQQIVSIIVSRKNKARTRVIIDAGGYRERHIFALEKMARETAQQVARSNKEKFLRPMNAYDRRIIHIALKEHKNVHTFSKGEGETRRIIIAPGKAPQKDAEKE
jgi:spoIIIJ-associated protein